MLNRQPTNLTIHSSEVILLKHLGLYNIRTHSIRSIYSVIFALSAASLAELKIQ